MEIQTIRMNIAEQAFSDLFPEKNISDYELKIKYNDKFKPYNANARYSRNSYQFNLSKKWRPVSKEIQMGLIQDLMLKIFKEKKKSINVDLYNSFMKNIHISVPKIKTDDILEGSFNRVNEKYFYGLIEMTNLVWHNSVRRLGSYEYGTDTISISRILDPDISLLDYVMYHEMLHKKHKFHTKNGRNHHHTKEFRQMERKFPNSEEMEDRIKNLVRKNRRRRFSLF